MVVTLPFLTTLVLSGFSAATAATSSSSSLLRHQPADHGAKMHRDLLIDTMHNKVRKLVDSDNSGFFDGETLCSYIEEGMSFDEAFGGDATGSCNCAGTIDTTLELSCGFTNVCDEQDQYCGTVNFSITMSNLIDGEGNLGENPSLQVKACADIDEVWLAELCFILDYSGVDFLVPVSCGVTYDKQECECTVGTVQLDATFDIEVPCLTWSCAAVAPEQLGPFLAEDQCGDSFTVEEGEADASAVTLSSMNSLESIPPEVVAELEADAALQGNSGAFSKSAMGAALLAVGGALLA